MRFLIFICLLLQFNLLAKGQLTPVYSQYLVNGLLINPAYAGSRDVLSALVDYRNQWAGFNGSPVSQTVTAHMPLQNKSLAIGALITNESIGITTTTGIFGNYAYRIRLNNGMLAFGLKAGVELLNENDGQLHFESTKSDPAFGYIGTSVLPNFGVGIYYYNQNYFAGLSLPEILS